MPAKKTKSIHKQTKIKHLWLENQARAKELVRVEEDAQLGERKLFPDQ
jgi:hypothetical protein